jgi:putative transposase
MARRPRIYIPGLTLHVVQRGNNKSEVFRDPSDYKFFLRLLRHESVRQEVAIHAYALMTNHFHLMATPADDTGLSKMMQSVGRSYVPVFNLKHQRTGTLWEGRFRSFVIETESYWLKCMRYIELNPVRAGMVSKPHQYRWSSAPAHLEGSQDELLTSHPLYVRLGTTATERQRAWRAMCGEVVPETELAAMRDAIRRGQECVQKCEGV